MTEMKDFLGWIPRGGMCPLLRGLPRRSPLNRRNTRKPPRASTLLAVIERLESRAMLAGLGQDSLSGLGSITAVLLPGISSPPGIVLTCGSPTLGSTAGTGGSQSTSPVLLSGTGSGTSSTPSGTGSSSTPNGRCSLAARVRGPAPQLPRLEAVPIQTVRCSCRSTPEAQTLARRAAARIMAAL